MEEPGEPAKGEPNASAGGQRKPPAFLLMGVTDDQRSRITYGSWDKPPRMILQGTASFLGQLTELPWSPIRVYTGGAKLAIEARVPKGPSINFMADADLYRRALGQAVKFVEKVGTPCFNHPVSVLGTTREAVARKLTGIAGLEVPVTVRVCAERFAQLREAVEKAGMRYPVLMRMAGDHGGVSTVLVNGPDDWEAANPLPWGGRDAYLTQFTDFRDEDGFYRKVRLAVAGSEVFLKHRFVSKQWLVHLKSHLHGTQEQERAFMDRFDAEHLPRLRPVLLEMARRLGLDYFGVDACLRPDGSLLLFEANATMNILTTHEDETDLWIGPSERIKAALFGVLSRPQAWRGPAQA